jgi:hypothetical protein
MSWKNFASFALAALLASPVLAQPALTVVGAGTGVASLNAQGDWVWNVRVAAGAAQIVGGSSSLAVEAGFTAATAGSGLVSTPTLIAGSVFDTANPGNSPFAAPIAGVQNGIVSNGNSAFAAYGSSPVANGNANNFIQIITRGPAVAAGRSLTSSVAVSGAYTVAGALGGSGYRVAQEGVNYNPAAFAVSRTVIGGDVNMNGTVDFSDFQILSSNFGGSAIWTGGDLDGSGSVNFSDFQILSSNFGGSGPPPAIAAGAAVPEPATIALIGLAVGALALRRRS